MVRFTFVIHASIVNQNIFTGLYILYNIEIYLQF